MQIQLNLCAREGREYLAHAGEKKNGSGKVYRILVAPRESRRGSKDEELYCFKDLAAMCPGRRQDICGSFKAGPGALQ